MCIGGGGLISGISLAVNAINPKCRIHGVEPQGGDDAAQSVLAGKIVDQPGQKTIAEGAALNHIGDHNLPIMCKYVDKIVNVKDDALIECMRFFGERCKMVVEPTGCLGVAGVQQLVRDGVIKPGDRVACLISGGNIDMTRYNNLLTYGTDNQELILEKMAAKLNSLRQPAPSAFQALAHSSSPHHSVELSASEGGHSTDDDSVISKTEQTLQVSKKEIPQLEPSDNWAGWSYVNSISKEDRWNLSSRKPQHAKSILS